MTSKNLSELTVVVKLQNKQPALDLLKLVGELIENSYSDQLLFDITEAYRATVEDCINFEAVSDV